MALAQRGRKHTVETKAKIGKGNRGKKMPPDFVARHAELMRHAYASGRLVAPFKGKSLAAETRAKIADGQRAHWASLSAEDRTAMVERRAATQRGIKRTPEQKERYKAATLKRMKERPETFQIFKDTSLEKDFGNWCEEKGVIYRKQCFITYDGEQHPFDFYLPEWNMLVECDGPHHWAGPYFTSNKGLSREEEFDEQKRKDDFWTNAATQLGYTIVRLIGIKSVGDEGSGTIEEQIIAWLDALGNEVNSSIHKTPTLPPEQQ